MRTASLPVKRVLCFASRSWWRPCFWSEGRLPARPSEPANQWLFPIRPAAATSVAQPPRRIRRQLSGPCAFESCGLFAVFGGREWRWCWPWALFLGSWSCGWRAGAATQGECKRFGGSYHEVPRGVELAPAKLLAFASWDQSVHGANDGDSNMGLSHWAGRITAHPTWWTWPEIESRRQGHSLFGGRRRWRRRRGSARLIYIRPCTDVAGLERYESLLYSQDRFTQWWLGWSFGGITFAVAAARDTTPQKCVGYINAAVYSAQGGSTGGTVNRGFCLKYQWACDATSVTFCKLQRQAAHAVTKWSGARALTAFNGLLGVDIILLASFGRNRIRIVSAGTRMSRVQRQTVGRLGGYLSLLPCAFLRRVRPTYHRVLSVPPHHRVDDEYPGVREDIRCEGPGTCWRSLSW